MGWHIGRHCLIYNQINTMCDVQTFSLGQLKANCYVLIKGESCIIVDPADDAPFLLEEISRQNLRLIALIATHGHFDHIMAVGEIQAAVPGIPFYIHHADRFLMNRIGETAKYFLGYEPQIRSPFSSQLLEKGNLLLGDFSLEVIETPGHTPGSSTLFFEKEGTAFTGDTLFSGSVGRYDFSYSSRESLKESVERLLKLPAETSVYPGHGHSTTIGSEQNIIDAFF